jgi:hypothetical protein
MIEFGVSVAPVGVFLRSNPCIEPSATGKSVSSAHLERLAVRRLHGRNINHRGI